MITVSVDYQDLSWLLNVTDWTSSFNSLIDDSEITNVEGYISLDGVLEEPWNDTDKVNLDLMDNHNATLFARVYAENEEKVLNAIRKYLQVESEFYDY